MFSPPFYRLSTNLLPTFYQSSRGLSSAIFEAPFPRGKPPVGGHQVGGFKGGGTFPSITTGRTSYDVLQSPGESRGGGTWRIRACFLGWCLYGLRSDVGGV